MMKLSNKQINGLIRHTLTFAGGILLTLGVVDAALIESATGAILTLVGVIMSAINKKKEDDSNESSSEPKS